jgi:hypothetical protein
MAQVDFAYEMAADAAGLPLAVSIFADDERVRDAMRDDVEAAGFSTRECGKLAPLAELPGLRLRELSETDRLALLRLTEQVGKLAERLDGMDRRDWGKSAAGGAFRFEKFSRRLPRWRTRSRTDAQTAPAAAQRTAGAQDHRRPQGAGQIPRYRTVRRSPARRPRARNRRVDPASAREVG